MSDSDTFLKDGDNVAYVDTNNCKTAAHVIRAEEYITRPEKTNGGKLVYYNEFTDESKTFLANCNETAKYFNIRKRDRLAYQIIQSFPMSDKCTPEQVFEITKEYAEKAFPGYQYVVTTHVDGNNIHSHILMNSVNSLTGRKFPDNKKTVAVLRHISDEICRKYGLSIIDSENGLNLKSIDKTTYELAKQGRSWKAELIKDIDALLKDCTDMKSFYNELEKKGYQVTPTNKNITIQKIGEKKGIRVDTLAKQFGARLKKENIEKQIRQNASEPELLHFSNEKAAEIPFSEYNTEFQRMQTAYFRRPGKRPNFAFMAAKAFIRPFGFNKVFRTAAFIKTGSRYLNRSAQAAFHPQIPKSGTLKNTISRSVGNISYKMLVNSYGENCTISVTPEELKKLTNDGKVFFSGYIKNDKIYITFKQINSDLIAESLNRNISDFKTEKEISYERYLKREFKAKATGSDKIVRTYVEREDVLKLENSELDFAYTRYDEKFSVMYFEKDMQRLCGIIGRDYEQEQINQFAVTQKHNYAELKKHAQESNTKLQFRVVDKNGLQILRSADFKFAVFEKENGKYNCCFAQKDIDKYNALFAPRGRQIKR